MPQLISERPKVRLFGRDGEITGVQRAVAAAEAPAVHHRDGRLLVPAQFAPPGIGFGLRLARALESLRCRLAEIFLQIHAGGPGAALAGQHQHAHIIAELELLERLQHGAIERRVHRIALVRPVEFQPGDAILD